MPVRPTRPAKPERTASRRAENASMPCTSARNSRSDPSICNSGREMVMGGVSSLDLRCLAVRLDTINSVLGIGQLLHSRGCQMVCGEEFFDQARGRFPVVRAERVALGYEAGAGI